MIIDFSSPGLSGRSRLRAAKALIVAVCMGATAASAQTSPDQGAGPASDRLSTLYDCASLYVVINKCSAKESSAASRQTSVVAAENRDKVIHLVFVDGVRAGILTETLLGNLRSSIQKMMNSIDSRCQNLARPLADLGPSCDRLIKDVPKQPYDRRNEFGSSEVYTPVSTK